MSQLVTAEVVKLPEPQWPTLYVAAGIVVDDGSWMVAGSSHGMDEAKRNLIDFADPIVTAIIPASTAAPEPDWVAELCKIKDVYIEVLPHDGEYEVWLIRKGHNRFNTRAIMACGAGHTYQLAAKAVVEKLRSQPRETPNPAACGGSE